MKRALILAIALALPLAAGEDHNCDVKHQTGSAKHAEHGKSCDLKTAEGTVVEMDGKLLCRSCDLKQTDTCEKVFQPASDSAKLIAICHGSKVDVEELSGSAVHVKGKMVKCGGDGKEELYIETASKI